ncbi:alpha/beta fold hydrolase [Amycolatopsis sp. 195334CR]|uniref:alpha/beta fold hydrolase n=1 Tax=Amycolatopsis sp. 195334CR TaxID=2814588 RepID=UPI001A8DE2CD|nr:alpha/beta hydrolase [Amycolatopsis sp. 195334CR]MBN6039600.1 alpha/beta hydrolase [Amycolatopsis sp. 195334CR]
MGSVTTSDGITLHLTDEGSGPAVVLVAGYRAAAETWVLQADALTAAGYRVLCLDRRSQGRSDAPAFGQRMARHGKDLHDALVAAELDEVLLIGSSMGASTIWSYVDLFGGERVRGVVSIDQTPRMINGNGWSYGFYGLDTANSGDFFTGGVPETGKGLSAEQASQGLLRLVDRLGAENVSPPPDRPETLPLLHDHAHQDWRDVIARAEFPVLMVAGRESQFWPCEHAGAAIRDTRSGRAVVLEDAGHATHLDRPDAVNDALLAFAGDL